MSLPKYIVNWDELLDLFKDKINIDVKDIGLGDLEDYLNEKLGEIIDLLKQILDLFTEKGLQRIHSMAENIPAMVGTYKFSKTFDADILLIGITYSQSAWKYQDSWDLEIGGRLLFDDIATKELGEHKNFNVFYLVPAGTPINILYHNTSGNSRIVWFDIEYIDLITQIVTPQVPTGGVVINYLTEEGILLDSDTKAGLSIRSHVFLAKEISGYRKLEPTSQTVELTEDNPMAVVNFYYKELTGTIILKYETTDGNVLLADDIFENLIFDIYTYEAKKVYGYKPLNNSIKLRLTPNDDYIEYTFLYELIKGTIILKYQDDDGKTLSSDLEYRDLLLDRYSYDAKYIPGYKALVSSITLTLTEDNTFIEYVFIYEKIKGNVTLKYQLENGISIAKDTVITDLELGYYTYYAKHIEKFELIEGQNNPITLNLAEENNNIEYIFIYKKIKGTIILKYELEDGSKIAEDIVYEELDLGFHKYYAKKIEGYELLEEKTSPVVLNLTLENRYIEHIFKYKKFEDKIEDIFVYSKKRTIVGVVYIDEDIEALEIKGYFDSVTGDFWPDLNVRAPDKTWFGYNTPNLDTYSGGSLHSLNCCESIEYNGWGKPIEVYKISKPMKGYWLVEARGDNAPEKSLVEISSTINFKKVYNLVHENKDNSDKFYDRFIP